MENSDYNQIYLSKVYTSSRQKGAMDKFTRKEAAQVSSGNQPEPVDPSTLAPAIVPHNQAHNDSRDAQTETDNDDVQINICNLELNRYDSQYMQLLFKILCHELFIILNFRVR